MTSWNKLNTNSGKVYEKLTYNMLFCLLDRGKLKDSCCTQNM